MGKNLNWTAGFEWAVVQISSQLQVASLRVHTGANVPPPRPQVTGKKCTLSSLTADSKLWDLEDLLGGRNAVQGQGTARTDSREPRGAQQRQMQALRPHPG